MISTCLNFNQAKCNQNYLLIQLEVIKIHPSLELWNNGTLKGLQQPTHAINFSYLEKVLIYLNLIN